MAFKLAGPTGAQPASLEVGAQSEALLNHTTECLVLAEPAKDEAEDD